MLFVTEDLVPGVYFCEGIPEHEIDLTEEGLRNELWDNVNEEHFIKSIQWCQVRSPRQTRTCQSRLFRLNPEEEARWRLGALS